jgi:hypothetical protein
MSKWCIIDMVYDALDSISELQYIALCQKVIREHKALLTSSPLIKPILINIYKKLNYGNKFIGRIKALKSPLKEQFASNLYIISRSSNPRQPMRKYSAMLPPH